MRSEQSLKLYTPQTAIDHDFKIIWIATWGEKNPLTIQIQTTWLAVWTQQKSWPECQMNSLYTSGRRWIDEAQVRAKETQVKEIRTITQVRRMTGFDFPKKEAPHFLKNNKKMLKTQCLNLQSWLLKVVKETLGIKCQIQDRWLPKETKTAHLDPDSS